MEHKLNFFDFIPWFLRGKSISRAILNVGLASAPPLSGITIDLGGGDGPTYKKLLKISGEFISMDAVPETNPTIIGNIEERLPFPDEYANNLLLCNVLEHAYGHLDLINECYRVLKPGGTLIIYVPFLIAVHRFQTKQFLIDDFYRYTQSSLEKMHVDAGFVEIECISQGGGFLVIGEILGTIFRFRIIRVPIFSLCMLLEKLYDLFKPGLSAKRFPLGYFVVARK
jgi:SAM-dependent methyltransferase